jgi:alpha-ketoglutarate-dependent taurine dioxygenase
MGAGLTSGDGFEVRSRGGEHGDLPRVVEPAPESRVDALCGWLLGQPEAVQESLQRHGAILFRGFDVQGPGDFERMARAIDDELKNEYLGTSPRDAVTDYVFNASELPDYFPIPQHCEMSFCGNPPRRVFFSCLIEPGAGSGETPLCDFRRVWNEIEPAVRDRFVERGLRHVRNYAGPDAPESADPTQLKPWSDMFMTRDRDGVEARCRAEGFEPEWTADGGLRLVSTQPIYRDHPSTGERVWHNHLTTFHVGTAVAEYERIAKFRPTDRHRGVLGMARKLDEQLRALPPEERGMHSTYADGSEIPEADLEHVRDVVWQNMVIEPWHRGDVVAIDNHSTSHGRLPYEGPRAVAVCWS